MFRVTARPKLIAKHRGSMYILVENAQILNLRRNLPPSESDRGKLPSEIGHPQQAGACILPHVGPECGVLVLSLTSSRPLALLEVSGVDADGT